MCYSSELCRRNDDEDDHQRGQVNLDEMMALMKNVKNFSGRVFQKLNTKEKYASFVGMCASCIMGYHRYRTALRKYIAMNKSGAGLCHNWLTPDDEAMCWLMIENGLAKWNAEFEKRSKQFQENESSSDNPNYGGFQSTKLTKDQKRALPLLKYTEKTTMSGKKKLCAWTHDAINRFKKLKREIVLFRYEHELVEVEDSEVEQLKPKIEMVNGKSAYVLTDKYKVYAEYATSVMSRSLEEESPVLSKKRKLGQDKSEHEQQLKREIDAVYNDDSLSMFSNIACSMPFLEL